MPSDAWTKRSPSEYERHQAGMKGWVRDIQDAYASTKPSEEMLVKIERFEAVYDLLSRHKHLLQQ